MTHDELLAKVKEIESFASYDPFQNAIKALRTIIEMHKPFISNGKVTNICDAHEQCWGCGEWGSSNDCPCDKYPCPTIQAIEEQLK